MEAYSCEQGEKLYMFKIRISWLGPVYLQLEHGCFELPMRYKRKAKLPEFSLSGVCSGSSRVRSFYFSKETRMFSHTSLFSAKPHISEWGTPTISVTHTSVLCEIMHTFPKECVLGDRWANWIINTELLSLGHMLSYLRCKYVFKTLLIPVSVIFVECLHKWCSGWSLKYLIWIFK